MLSSHHTLFSYPWIWRGQDNTRVRDVLCAFQAVEKVFTVPNGFFWQTVETNEEYFPDSSDIEACRDTDTEVKTPNEPLVPDLWDGVGS